MRHVPYDLIKAAEDLGKAKMVKEVKDRCGYPGVAEEQRLARVEYESRLQTFIAKVNEFAQAHA